MGIFGGLFGGGGAKAEVTNKVYTKAVSQVIASAVMKNSTSVALQQSMLISGNSGKGNINLSQKQAVGLQKTAPLTQQAITDLQTQVQNALNSTTKANSQALLGALGGSYAKVANDLSSEVVNSVSDSMINEVISNYNLNQQMTVANNSNEGDINAAQEQTLNAVENAAAQALSKVTALTSLDNAVKSDATATQSNPIADIITAVGGVFGAMASITGLVIFGIVAVIALFVYMLFHGAGKVAAKITPDGASFNMDNTKEEDDGYVTEEEKEQEQEPASGGVSVDLTTLLNG